MEKKSQPLLVIWVGMILVLMIGIGIAGYFAHTQPARQSRTQAALNGGTTALANSSAVAFGAPNTPAEPIRNQLADQTNEITVSIYDRGNGAGQARFLGSGVIVTEECVLTNAHIVNNKSNLFVYVFAPRPAAYPAGLFRCDVANDLALLKTTNNSKFLSVGLLGNPNELVAGDAVFAAGNAYGNGNLLMDGVIIDKNFTFTVDGQVRVRMRTNITISPGICGGPLVNTKGEVIGISNSLGNPETVTAIDKALALIYGRAQNQAASTAPTQVA